MTSMALPIHMLAISPQNSSGRWSSTSGPGRMPWIIMAPIITRHDRVGRNAEREHRDERGLRAGIVGGLRSGDAFHRALAEAGGVLRQLAFERIGGKRG